MKLYNYIIDKVSRCITLAPFMCLLVLCSCRTIKYVPVETIKVDTIYINKLQRDSIYMLDSVYVKEKGDTVLIEKYKYLYRNKLVRDTMYISKTDSINVPYLVEKELTKWQQFRMDFGGWVIMIIAITILIIAIQIVCKLKK
ncbi:Uncharacterised protein [uncultured Bacteroides sp.]|nr:Uncharacterised protein [uncultured Bacteroides sp.]